MDPEKSDWVMGYRKLGQFDIGANSAVAATAIHVLTVRVRQLLAVLEGRDCWIVSMEVQKTIEPITSWPSDLRSNFT